MSFRLIKSEFVNNLIYILIETEEYGILRLFADTSTGQTMFLKIDKKPTIISYFPRTNLDIFPSDHPYGNDVNGLLGYQFFTQRIWNINYKNQTIAMYKRDVYKNVDNKIILHASPDYTHLSVPVIINKKRFWFLLGIGSYITTKRLSTGISYNNIQLDSNTTPAINSDKYSRSAISYITSTFVKKLTRLGIKIKYHDKKDDEKRDLISLPTIKIGKFTIQNAKFIVLDGYCYDTVKQIAGKHVRGSIGGNILKNFNVVINYPEKYLWLKRI